MRKICLGLICLALTISFAGCGKDGASAPDAPTVEAARAAKTDVAWDVEYPAQAAGSVDVDVRAQVGGILQSKFFKEGDYVEAGVQLFQIDPSQYQIALTKAEGTLSQAKTDVSKTKRDYDRMNTLFKENAVSRKDYDDALSAYEKAKANRQIAQGGVDDAKRNMEYTKVLAPNSGITRNDKYSVGNLISTAGESSFLLNIVQIDPMEVDFSIPSRQWHALLRSFQDGKLLLDGKMGEQAADVQVILSDGSAFPHLGKMKFVDAVEDEKTGSITAKANVPNPDKKRNFMPGQFVKVVLKGLYYKDAIVLPMTAVLSTAKGKMVYVAENGVAVLKPVAVTEYKDYAIVEGINEGDIVVTSGVIKVKPNSPVNPQIKELDLSSLARHTATVSSSAAAVN